MVKIRDRIKYVSTSDLKEYEKNNKKHSEDQVSLLVQMIAKFGFTTPLLIDKKYNIIAGHGRKLAAEKLGMKKLPCIIIDDLSENEIKALRIADNRIGELANTDWTNIQDEFNYLQDEGSGLEFLTGYKEEDFLGVEELNEPKEVKEDDFDIPDEIKTDIKQGDIIKLGNHRLMCGDSTDESALQTLLKNTKMDMCFTDPPYNTGMQGNSQSTWLTGMFDDKYSDNEWEEFITKFTKIYFNILKEDSVAYICLDWRRNHELVPKIKESGFKLSNIIVWDKIVHGLGSDYKYTYELLNVCKKGKPDLNTHQGDREYSDVWHIQRKLGKDEDHATKKPIELCARAIRHVMNVKTVVDLFGGSGSTLIACEQLDKQCYMVELEPKYCEVICRRWEKLTGKTRELLN
jgi:site-specific DNA-methyltransferase (adenine-specific)